MGEAQRRALVGKPIDDDPKAAWREYQPKGKALPARRRASAMDTEAMTVLMDADPLRADQIEKARRTVAAQAVSDFPDDPQAQVEATREALLMLGIHSSQSPDTAILGPPNLTNNATISKPKKPLVTQK